MSYVFDPLELQQIALNSIRKNLRVDDLVSDVRSQMLKSYPKHINRNPKWILNNAGGAMGAMCVLHVSLTEYVMIFGTPLGTEGHTGRFYVDDYFIILAGEQWAFSAGQLTRETYRPGDIHHLRRGEAKQYKMPELCWALEYARGPIVTMFPFGLADGLTSTLDFRSMMQTIWVATKSTTRELLQGKI